MLNIKSKKSLFLMLACGLTGISTVETRPLTPGELARLNYCIQGLKIDLLTKDGRWRVAKIFSNATTEGLEKDSAYYDPSGISSNAEKIYDVICYASKLSTEEKERRKEIFKALMIELGIHCEAFCSLS